MKADIRGGKKRDISKSNGPKIKQNPSRKKRSKKKISLKKIFTINKHNQNAKRLKMKDQLIPSKKNLYQRIRKNLHHQKPLVKNPQEK